ncbi:hypothetical protein BJF82_03170 [Kytococcus sp. CUA-901]|nr:hypothetical protein BJF82_03170 [Kytococcus sp. CUA-901]
MNPPTATDGAHPAPGEESSHEAARPQKDEPQGTPSEGGSGFTADETEIGGADAVPEKTTGSETRDDAEF